MWNFYTQSYPVAKDDYYCEGCEHILNNDLRGELSISELRTMASAKRDQYRIKQGTQYLKISGMFDGRFTTYKARRDIHELCMRHQLYEA